MALRPWLNSSLSTNNHSGVWPVGFWSRFHGEGSLPSPPRPDSAFLQVSQVSQVSPVSCSLIFVFLLMIFCIFLSCCFLLSFRFRFRTSPEPEPNRKHQHQHILNPVPNPVPDPDPNPIPIANPNANPIPNANPNANPIPNANPDPNPVLTNLRDLPLLSLLFTLPRSLVRTMTCNVSNLWRFKLKNWILHLAPVALCLLLHIWGLPSFLPYKDRDLPHPGVPSWLIALATAWLVLPLYSRTDLFRAIATLGLACSWIERELQDDWSALLAQVVALPLFGSVFLLAHPCTRALLSTREVLVLLYIATSIFCLVWMTGCSRKIGVVLLFFLSLPLLFSFALLLSALLYYTKNHEGCCSSQNGSTRPCLRT